jgi:hypothetical protein
VYINIGIYFLGGKMEPMQIFFREIMKRDDLKKRAVEEMVQDGDFLERAVKRYAQKSIQEGTIAGQMEQFLIDAMNLKDWQSVENIAGALRMLQDVDATETMVVRASEDVIVTPTRGVFG